MSNRHEYTDPSMRRASFDKLLGGGDRRSIGQANQVAAAVLRQPERLAELMACLSSDDPLVRMRAADAAEKVSVKKAAWLQPFKDELLRLADKTEQQELRWHLALMIPRLALTKAERQRAVVRFHDYLRDHSSIVKTCAIQGLAELARGDARSEAGMEELLRRLCRTGTPAMKARSRKLLKELRGR